MNSAYNNGNAILSVPTLQGKFTSGEAGSKAQFSLASTDAKSVMRMEGPGTLKSPDTTHADVHTQLKVSEQKHHSCTVKERCLVWWFRLPAAARPESPAL